jgi:hypothetical protein
MHQAGRLTSRYWSLSLAGLIYINASEEDGADASNAMLAGEEIAHDNNQIAPPVLQMCRLRRMAYCS